MTAARRADRRRRSLAIAGLLGLGTIAALSVDRPATPSTWVAVERRALDRTVSLSGRLRAVNVTQYGPPVVPRVWNFKISFIAPEGIEVAAGEPVIAFDTTELEERLRRNQSELDTANENLKKRLQDLGVLLREEELAASEAQARVRTSTLTSELPAEVMARRALEKAEIERQLAEREVDYRESRIAHLDGRSRAEIAALEAQRSRAANEVTEIEQSIESMTVRAERTGVVMYRAGFQGEKKRLGDIAWRGEHVVEIPELGAMVADAWVLEADAGLLEPGLEAQLVLEAEPRESLRATITSLQRTIDRRSDQDPRKVVRLDLTVSASGSNLARPGMRVQGSIVVERRPPVLAVPVAAIRRGEHGPIVTTRRWLRGGQPRPVELGRRQGTWVEVISGLEEGERVLTDST
jgi:multidrug efflux pump subunit AcrA (membrane-fusion protein)